MKRIRVLTPPPVVTPTRYGETLTEEERADLTCLWTRDLEPAGEHHTLFQERARLGPPET